MKKLSVLSLVLFLIISCTKPPLDQIVVTPLIPEVEFFTVMYYSPSQVPLGCPNVPTPRDSSITYEIDLDQDSTADFQIRARHSPVDQYCGHCSRHIYAITVIGVHAGDSIRVDSINPWIPKKFLEGDTLRLSGKYNYQTELLLQEGCTLPFNANFQDQYVAVKSGMKVGWIHVRPRSNNGIIIQGFAVNLTDGNGLIINGE